MKKQTEIIIITGIIILAIALRLLFWSEGVYGSDIFYHYTIVEQAIEGGQLSNDNNLAVCYEGAKEGHPLGYYFLPYIFGKIIGLDAAFILVPVLVGIIGLLVIYWFIKLVFGRKTALWTIAFLAITLAHVSKSFPFSYRGDNLIFPFLFLSLISIYKFAIEEKKYYSLLGGISSGITSFIWNGYPLIILIYIGTLFSLFGYLFFRKEKNFEKKMQYALVSLMVQGLVVMAIVLTTELAGKGLIFGRMYYPIMLVSSLVALGALYISHKKRTYWPLVILAIAGAVGVLLFFGQIEELASGFGSIKQEGIKTSELYNTQWYQYFFGLYILGILGVFGLYNFFKEFNEKRCLFIGLLVASIYLLFSASRYIFFSSVAIVTLASLFLNNKKMLGKKFDLFVVLSIAVYVVMIIYALHAIPLYFAQSRFIPDTEPFLFLKENTPSDACVMHTGERGAAIEYFSKRYFYLHSLGHALDREEKMVLFLLDNRTAYLDGRVTHVLLYYADLTMMNRFNGRANKTEIGFFRITGLEKDTESEEKVIKELGFMQAVHIGGKTYINKTGVGCYFQYQGDEFYLKPGVCDTNLFKIITNQRIEGLKNVYFKKGYSIYEVDLPKTS